MGRTCEGCGARRSQALAAGPAVGRVIVVGCTALALLAGTASKADVPMPAAALSRATSAGAPMPAPVNVAPGIYVFRGLAGEPNVENFGRTANVSAIVGPRGVAVVESGVSFRHGEAIIEALGRITPRPIRLLILTHAGQEVVFGAAAFQARGIPVLMHRDAAALMAARCDQCLERLNETLGVRAMVGTRLVKPDVMIDASTAIDTIGRRLRLLAPAEGSPPGALAVFDAASSTLIGGSLVTVDRIPDLRDSDGSGWPIALERLGATRCAHLVPSYGSIGDCTALSALEHYFSMLELRTQALFAAGVGLAEVARRADLPEFAAWDGYAKLHGANAERSFLRVERGSFAK
jgi:glyoxylase-like metal-dependent hydrolase (beta-lactamase superfamily II)